MLYASISLASAGLALVLFASEATGQSGSQATYSDPIAYCRGVGTVDRPGPRYRGQDEPVWLRRFIGATEDYHSVSWRCLNGHMVACLAESMHGEECAAPITSRVSDASLREYCALEPNAAFIPMSHARYHLHEWGCRRGRPYVTRLRPTQDLDERGFWRGSWRVVRR